MKKIISIVTTLILIICGSLLVGCNDPYSGLSLSFDEDSIVLLVGQDSTFNVKIENYNQNDLDLAFDVQGNVAKVISCDYLQNGVYSFTISPLVDETINSNLKISILGTDKSLIIPLKVSLEIQGISLNTSPYVVKRVGEKLDLSTLDFTFNPSSTYQTDLKFLVNGNYFNGIIEVVEDNDDKLNSNKDLNDKDSFNLPYYIPKSLGSSSVDSAIIHVKAESSFKTDIFVNFEVRAVNEIKEEQINLFEYKVNEEITRQITEYSDSSNEDFIELIINDKDYSSKIIEVQRQIIPPFYAYDINVIGKDGKQSVLTLECLDSTTTSGLESQNIKFKLSAGDVSDNEFVVLWLYSKDFPTYKVTKQYRVVSKIIPTGIKINNADKVDEVSLYDTNTSADAKVFNVSIYEQQSICDGMSVKFYSVTKDTEGKRQETELNIETVLEYINLEINGVSITKESDINKIINPKSYNEIKTYGKQSYKDGSIEMRFSAESNYGYWKNGNNSQANNTQESESSNNFNVKKTFENSIVFNVYKGAEKFDVKEIYKQDGHPVLYIEKGTTQVFGATYDDENEIYISNDDFNFGDNTDDIHIGEIYTTLSIESIGICNVSQFSLQNNGKNEILERAIQIEALNVGTAYCTLKIDSGLSLTISIVVFEPLKAEDSSLSFEANSDIAKYEYSIQNITNGITVSTLSQLVISGTNKTVKLVFNTNQNASMYEISGFESDNTNVVISDSSRLLFKTSEIGDSTLTLTIRKHNVENFVIIGNDEYYVYTVNITSFTPIQSFELSAKNSYQTSDSMSAVVNVYSNRDLGYYDKLLSKIEFKITQNGEIKSLANFAGDIKISFSIASEQSTYNGNIARLLSVGPMECGYFYLSGGSAYFECTKSIISQNDSFKVYATIDQYGKTYSSSVTINIKEYIKAKEIWLKNYTDSIYLDTRNEYSSVKLYPYIMPLDVINKEIFVKYEAVDSTAIGAVQVVKQDDCFEIKYSGVGYGKGTLYLIPMSSFTSETDYTTNNSIKFNVTVANGRTKDSAIHITSLDELKAINNAVALSRHYVITQNIDAQGQNLHFGTLTGSITGIFNGKVYGGISNFVINTINEDGTCGLFSKIDGGELSYLNISGSFKIEQPKNEPSEYKIGLLTGENNGTIKNVNVTVVGNSNNSYDISLFTIDNNKNTVISAKSANIGFVAGVNNGTIIVENETIDGKEVKLTSTLMAYNNKDNHIAIYGSSASNIGGITGKNLGSILNNCSNIKKINLYGTNAHVYINAVGKYLGAVAGENQGTITGITAVGELRAYFDNTTNTNDTVVGGLVGLMQEKGKIEYNISRVFVRAYKYVSGLIGEIKLSANSNYTISNNTVQAVDDGTRLGIDASLIVLLYNDDADATLANIYAYISKTDDISDDIVTNLNTNIDKNNENETYFADYSIVNGTITTTANSRRLVESRPINNYEEYYGDIVAYKFTGNKVTQLGSNENYTLLNSGSINKLGTLPTKQILQYYKAKDSNNQVYLAELNRVNLRLNVNEYNVEYNVSVVSGSCIEALATGEINILGNGFATVRITNSLNYKDYHEISIFVTNKVDGVRFYEDIDGAVLISDNSLVNVTDSKNTVIYQRFYANAPKNDGNLYIELVDNTDLTLEVPKSSSSDVIVNLSANSLAVRAKTGSHGNFTLDLKTKYEFEDGTKFYLCVDNNNSYFVSASDNSILQTTINVNAVSGIYNLNIDKNLIDKIVPSDIINFVVTYNNNNKDDALKLVVSDDFGNVFEEVAYDKDNIYLSNGTRNLYKVKKEIVNTNENFYTVKYKLSLVLENNNVELLSNKSFNFSFFGKSSYNVTNEIKTAKVNYMAEPIKSVLVKNFNEDSNGSLVEREENSSKRTYNAKNSLIDSDIVVTGEVNVLKLYIDSYYSNYEYIDITSDNIGGYNASFNLIAKVAGNTTSDFNYELAGEVAYLNNGIRIDKNHARLEKSGNYLIVSLIYRLPSDIDENQMLNIHIDFLDLSLNKVTDTISKTVRTKRTRSVNLEIVDKTPIDTSDNVNVYSVARGYEYQVNIDHYGYEESELTILSSSPYAKIEKVNGLHILKIADSVVYHANTEYEEVLITAYGTKIVEGKEITSKSSYLKLNIYEYVFNINKGIKGLFESDSDLLVSLALSTTVDIREMIANLINIEYSPSAQSSVNALIKNFIQNAKFYVVDNISKKDLSGISDLSQTDYYFNNYLFTPYKIYEEYPYKFVVSANVKFEMGRLVFSTPESEDNNNSVEIGAEVYSIGSTKNPTPIYTLKDLYDMKENGYYRLMQDITINSSSLSALGYNTFNPLVGNFALLDGNSYSINLQGVYRYVDISQFGLFSEISSSSTVLNLNINIVGTFTVYINNITNAETLNIGLLSAKNDGVINNCSITYSKNFACIFNISASDESLIGALVGENNGYITNSRVNVKVTSNGASLAGFVGRNNNHIASSYVAKSNITNASGTVDATSIAGGFVVYNSGNIFSSYIKGEQGRTSAMTIYSSNPDYALYSNSRVAGFVYGNSGKIEDCYSDIPIVSSSYNAGFVYENTGAISRVYSTSALESSQSTNFPFVYIADKGEFNNCFFLKDRYVNNNTSPLNNNIKGITKLSLKDFNNAENFKAFAMLNNEDMPDKSVWFMAQNRALESTASDGFAYRYSNNAFQLYDLSTNTLNNMTFIGRRPELVSANIIAVSRYEIDNQNTKADETTGEIIYAYNLVSTKALKGTKYNPYVITTAKEFEDVVYGANAYSTSYNNVRIAKDLNYEEENIKTSMLYKKLVCADIDGNNLSISNFIINDNKNLTYSGFIGRIGDDFSVVSVRSLDLYPKYINTPNANYAGTLSGYVKNAVISNVNVLSNIDIISKNIVGGLVGFTTGTTVISNCSTLANSKATYTNTSEKTLDMINNFTYKVGSSVGSVSYAGGIVGYAHGSTTITNIYFGDDIKVQGMITGLISGGISANSVIYNIDLTLNAVNYLGSYFACGYVVGESKGTIKNVSINYHENSETAVKEAYLTTSKNPISSMQTPLIVGGICGIMTSGSIESISINCPVIAKNSQVVGGVVGYMTSGKVLDCRVVTTLCGMQTVGGVVGQIEVSVENSVKISGCTVSIQQFGLNLIYRKMTSLLQNFYAGSIAGQYYIVPKENETSPRFSISGCEIQDNIELILTLEQYNGVALSVHYTDVNRNVNKYSTNPESGSGETTLSKGENNYQFSDKENIMIKII